MTTETTDKICFDPPTKEQIQQYAIRQNLNIAPDELDDAAIGVSDFLRLIKLDRLDELEVPTIRSRYSHRDPGRAPTAEEDPYNAIIRYCHVEGAKSGPLSGMRIGVKDNIAVADIPLTEGNRYSSPIVPTEDAVVVERLLDAGANIVAKTNINLVGDGGFGLTRNPHNPRFGAGASSSGSAAAVASGLVDAALGVEQAGSIRGPAACCGIVGMKPTHGLVPTYGLIYWDHTLDHIGPMTATVADSAAILQVIAGQDWRDPNSACANPTLGDYTAAESLGIDGIRIGVVIDALESSGCSTKTLEAFERAQNTLARLGAELIPVSIPLWSDVPTIWWATLTAGMTTLGQTFGQGYHHFGRINLDLLRTMAAQYLQRERELPWGGRTLALAFEHINSVNLGIPFGKAHNLRSKLRFQLDTVLSDVDLLITPTMPGPPGELPTHEKQRTSQDGQGNGQSKPQSRRAQTNTASLTGHPALTVPSGPGDHELPTGLQIIGRRFEEYTVYRAGFAFENAFST